MKKAFGITAAVGLGVYAAFRYMNQSSNTASKKNNSQRVQFAKDSYTCDEKGNTATIRTKVYDGPTQRTLLQAMLNIPTGPLGEPRY